MNISNSYSLRDVPFGMPEADFSFLHEIFARIEDCAKSGDCVNVLHNLKELCGSKGYVEVIAYQDNVQFHLFFQSYQRRHDAILLLNKLLAPHGLQEFEGRQTTPDTEVFPLKLGTNQTVACLGLNPYNYEFNAAQPLLRQLQDLYNSSLTKPTIKQSFTIDSLPNEMICSILKFSELKSIGRCAQICTKFAKLIQCKDSFAWRVFAMHKGISFKANEDVRLKIKEHYDPELKLFGDLKFSTNYTLKNFTYKHQEEIEKLGGICLTKDLDGKSGYKGIVVDKENEATGWVLHLCPGGGHCCFSVEDFKKLMPEAAKNLINLEITLTAVSGSIGRHSGNTADDFLEWQKQLNAKTSK